jgi:phosphoribosyl 1,2-cyclic phosphodiesterase
MIFFAGNMALFIASLNSGSNGNCYYVGSQTDAVLVDAGISCRETEKRMKQLGLSMQTVKAIFISHEHNDHIRGLTRLANKYSLPVYITAATMQNGTRLIRHLSQTFTADMPVRIGNLQVTAFSKQHDAVDPHSFIISCNEVTVGVFTDIGIACAQVTRYFKQCHAVFLESNYDEVMLDEGRYPIYLKNRIRGGQGHISNRQALELFLQHRPPFMSHVLLSHLSKENNSPQIAAGVFAPHAGDVMVAVAGRDAATPVYYITGEGGGLPPVKMQAAVQMGLWSEAEKQG